MLKGKRVRKMIAMFMLVVMLTNVLTPTISYALTSGPTQPEATSFEPIDTTDMVNLLTGDFTYNIPLLEVPGPEGGYPLSLSYHAGIQPNEDASWVGLGFTLNPGAINRNVNGFPDDFKMAANSSRSYWGGGNSKSININVGLGGESSSVSFGLSISMDSHKGVSYGVNAGFAMLSLGWDSKEGFSPSMGIGASSLLSMVSGSHRSSLDGKATGFDIILSTDFKSINATPTFSNNLNTGGSKDGSSTKGSSIGMGAVTGGVVNTTGKINTKGFSISIPLNGITLGYSQMRYWSDETVDAYIYGSIYTRDVGSQQYDDNGFDNYYVYDKSSSLADYPEPEMSYGGGFPNFDNYNVSAQGLSGSIRPYIYQGHLPAQDKVAKLYNFNAQYTPISPWFTTVYMKHHVQNIHGWPTPSSNYNATPDNGFPEFRFVNDFSNRFLQDYDNYSSSLTDQIFANPPFDTDPIYGENDENYSFNPVNKSLSGSKSIIYHSVNNGSAIPYGYVSGGQNYTSPSISTHASGTSLATQIGGFSITNESGVTYHYCLPAYSYDEIVHTEKIIQSGSGSGNEHKKGQPYAYTWHLTSITGPDFVDRGQAGILDNEDWGYWVSFDYGKWTDSYIWRNPSLGYHFDIDNTFKSFSQGKREIYYLNSIRTRTHTAIFEKDMRTDAKGAATSVYNTGTISGISGLYTSSGAFDNTSKASMRLDRIYLLNNIDVPSDLISNSSYSGHYGNNVVDKYDINPIKNDLISKSIKVIDFTYDYSLCKNTSNSFNTNIPTELYGKLTLKSFKLLGNRGAELIPPTKFSYDYSGLEVKEGLLNISSANSSECSFTFTTSVGLEMGEIMNIVMHDATRWQAVILDYNQVTSVYLAKIITSSGCLIPTGSGSLEITKNPDYNAESVDSWGMLKSDYDWNWGNRNPNTAKLPSPVSAKSVDAWSLRKISTIYGGDIKINYESDSYSKPAIGGNGSILLDSFYSYGPNQNLAVRLKDFNNKLEDFIVPGTKMNVLLLQELGAPFTTNVAYRAINCDEQIKASPSVLSTDNSAKIIYTDIPFNPIMGALPGDAAPNRHDVKAGNIVIYGSVNDRYGGGLRVKSISVINTLDNTVSSVLYNYNFLNKSSGTTSYEPNLFDSFDFGLLEVADGVVNQYRRHLYKDSEKILNLSREIPGPEVIYKNVSVSNSIKNPDEMKRDLRGSVSYEFQVFDKNMIDSKVLQDETRTIPGLSTQQKVKNIVVKSLASSVGALKRIISYDGNGKKISEQINHYLVDGLEKFPFNTLFTEYEQRLEPFNCQGLIKERYSDQVEMTGSYPNNYDLFAMSAKEEYPNIVSGQTFINYATGITKTTQNLKFDFYSGSVTESLETDGYGNRFMTKTIPAYRMYPEMGLKRVGYDFIAANYDLIPLRNKNMLDLDAASYVYKVDQSNNKLGLVSASVQTWSSSLPAINVDGTLVTQNTVTSSSSPYGIVWREQSRWNWLPVNKTSTGLTSLEGVGAFTDFVWSNPAASGDNWKKTSEISLYDVYSKILETKDVNGITSAMRMSYGEKKVILSASNAKFHEVAYSGAEDDALNQSNDVSVSKGNGSVVSTVAHTGVKSLQLNANGGKGMQYTVSTNKLVPGRNYLASVWVKPESGDVSDLKLYYSLDLVEQANLSSTTSTKTSDGWTLVILPIKNLPANKSLQIGCTNDHSAVNVYVDDFRFQPVTSSTTAYVYDPFSGDLTYVLNNNNLYTAYEYDAVGRLTKTYKEKLGAGKMKLSEIKYNIAGQISAPPSIYAKIFYDYVTSDVTSCGKTHIFDATIRFFSDEGGTVPMYVSDLTLDYFYQHNNMPINDVTYSQTVVIGGTPVDHYSLGTLPVYYEDFCALSGDGYAILTLQSGSHDYNVLPSSTPTLPQVYAKLVKTFVFSDFNGCFLYDNYDVDVAFYEDAECTIPAYVSQMKVPYWYNSTLSELIISTTPVHSVNLLSYVPLHVNDFCYTMSEYDILCELNFSNNFTIVY